MKKHIPNFITLINLFCGCCALLAVLTEQYPLVGLLLLIGVIADFGDGMIARALGVSSEMGKELDSLADMVSFGLVPGMIMYKLLTLSGVQCCELGEGIEVAALGGFLITIFSALRLAKFNIDTRQTEDFIGLATPSSTMYILGLLLIYHYDSMGLSEMVLNPLFLYASTFLISFLLVSELRLFGNKMKTKGWKGNEIRYIFFFACLLNFVLLGWLAFSVNVLLYIVMSLVSNAMKVKSEELTTNN